MQPEIHRIDLPNGGHVRYWEDTDGWHANLRLTPGQTHSSDPAPSAAAAIGETVLDWWAGQQALLTPIQRFTHALMAAARNAGIDTDDSAALAAWFATAPEVDAVLAHLPKPKEV